MRSTIEKWMREESAWFLTPFAYLWGWAAAFRHGLYRHNLLKTSRVKPFVINVGSIAVGGVGKTPLVMKLIEEFSGYKGALLTRGYRGADEALMVERRYPNILVKIGKNRLRNALAVEDCDFLLLDDGWQYRKLASDVAIAVLSDDVMKGSYIPKGRLRDLPCRLQEADLVVVTHGKIEKERVQLFTNAPVIFVEYVFRKIVWNREGISLDKGDPVACFCGIGNPDSFIQLINNQGFKINQSLVLSDHGKPSKGQLERLAKGVKGILCTEKDFVKLQDSPFLVGMVEIDYHVTEGAALFSSLVATWKEKIEGRQR